MKKSCYLGNYSYEIQKLSKGEWVKAFGLKGRTWITSDNEQSAAQEFRYRIGRVRIPYRLIVWDTFARIGFPTATRVVAETSQNLKLNP